MIRHHIEEAEIHPHSSGRGGIGNILASRSRSRGPDAATASPHALLYSTGRGGIGNMTPDPVDQVKLANEEKAEILEHTHHGPEEHHPHSTGRGGRANITDLPIPADAKEAHHVEGDSHVHSSGRGGLGNIHPDHHAAEEDHGERGREPHGSKNVLLHVWEKVRAASSSRSRAEAHAHAVAVANSVAAGEDK